MKLLRRHTAYQRKVLAKKFSKPSVSQNDGAKEMEKWQNWTIFAARTPLCQLACAMRNVPQLIGLFPIDSNVWWAWQWLLFIVIECLVRR